MSLITTFSNKFLEEVVKGQHDVSLDTLMVALMDSEFVFDPSVHSTYADCQAIVGSGSGSGSAGEIASGNGYTTGGLILQNVDVVINQDENKVNILADNATWTAEAGAMAETGAAIVYNFSHVNNTVLLCIEFGATYITDVGKLFQINFSNGLIVVDNG